MIENLFLPAVLASLNIKGASPEHGKPVYGSRYTKFYSKTYTVVIAQSLNCSISVQTCETPIWVWGSQGSQCLKCNCIQPKSDGLQPTSDGLQPNSNDLQPTQTNNKHSRPCIFMLCTFIRTFQALRCQFQRPELQLDITWDSVGAVEYHLTWCGPQQLITCLGVLSFTSWNSTREMRIRHANQCSKVKGTHLGPLRIEAAFCAHGDWGVSSISISTGLFGGQVGH